MVPYIGAGALTCLGLIIMIVQPISGSLIESGQIMLGGVIITLGIWIFKPFGLSFAMGGLFLALFALAIGLAPEVIFSGFTQPAIWTLIPALFFGFVLQKTGLGKRVALGVIKLFKPSYLSLVIIWVIIGIVLSILTPSITVRIAIIIPIALQCSQLCGLKPGSKGNSLVMLTAFAMALLPGTGWLTGSLWGPILQGMINATPQTQGLVTFDSWFSTMFIPLEIVTVLLVVGGIIVLMPKEKLSQDAIDSIKNEKLEKISRNEIITTIILVSVFVLFSTNRFHHIPDAAICLAAVFIFFLFGVLEAKDFALGVSWDLIVFIAMALSLSAIFSSTGIAEWLASVVIPTLKPIAVNPWVFTFGIAIIMFAWRFVDVAIFIPTMAIMTPILPAINEAYGISPLVWLPIFVMAGNAFFVAYQNMWAVMSLSISKEHSWTAGHLGIYGTIYFIACLLALIVGVILWNSNGLFG
jgi:anion transporter